MTSRNLHGAGYDHLRVQSSLLTHQVSGPAEDINIRELFPEIVARSPVMTNVLKTVCKIAKSSSSVLILGESGTGKELIASAVHRLSNRARHNYVAINCSAIPEDLLEAELFGHEKGAFTGADRKRIGHFGIANHGTIFLDEIGDMPPRLQAKLLRILQEKKYTPVGSSEVKEVDVRIVAATNVDLEEAVKSQKFRLDLYYRLNVLPIRLPPLRERPTDIPYLLEYFLEQANHSHALAEPCWFNEDVIDILCRFSWPGNVRHLQNLIERLVIMKGAGLITINDIPAEVIEEAQNKNFQTEISKKCTNKDKDLSLASPNNFLPTSFPPFFEDLPEYGLDLTSHIEKIENYYIMEALRRTNNNKNQAAKLLGLNRTTLVERIKKRKLCHSKDLDDSELA